MRIAEIVVELHGTRDVTLNGRDCLNGGTITFDEKVFTKQLTAEQQWACLCEARKLMAKMEHAYRNGQILRGERPADGAGKLISIPNGVKGVMGKLGGG